jgi:hypothetical protein
MMHQYKIEIEGRNYLIRFEAEIKRVGFFTTRWIDTSDPESAKIQAIELVQNELRDLILNERSNPPVLLVQRVSVVDASERSSSKGGGFTWYLEDEKTDRKGDRLLF